MDEYTIDEKYALDRFPTTKNKFTTLQNHLGALYAHLNTQYLPESDKLHKKSKKNHFTDSNFSLLSSVQAATNDFH